MIFFMEYGRSIKNVAKEYDILNGQILDGIEFEYTKECKKIYKTREGAII